MKQDAYQKIFRYCPGCGHDGFEKREASRWVCPICQYEYFHNPAAAVIGLLFQKEKVLLTVRERDPSKGLYDLPGGFVEYNESGEEALKREIKEELEINIGPAKYIGSYTNQYLYNKILYHTLDLTYVCQLPDQIDIKAGDDILDYQFFACKDIPWDRIAFPSIKKVLIDYYISQNDPVINELDLD